MRQTLALGAYNADAPRGNCPTNSGATAQCFHDTGSSNFNMTDNRPMPAASGSFGPHGSDIVLYETPRGFGAAFSQGKNLEWIQHELASLPAKEKASGQSKSNNSAASIHGDARSSLH